MEMADLLAINKADGDNIKKASMAKAAYKNALHLLPPHEFGWTPEATTCSSLTGDGIDTIWQKIEDYYNTLEQKGSLAIIRQRQQKEWLNETLQNRLLEDFLKHSEVKKQLPVLEKKVLSGRIIPSTATRELIKLVLS